MNTTAAEKRYIGRIVIVADKSGTVLWRTPRAAFVTSGQTDGYTPAILVSVGLNKVGGDAGSDYSFVFTSEGMPPVGLYDGDESDDDLFCRVINTLLEKITGSRGDAWELARKATPCKEVVSEIEQAIRAYRCGVNFDPECTITYCSEKGLEFNL